MIDKELSEFIAGIPKAEVHIHLDSVYPDLLLRIAERNGVSLPFTSVDEANSWYVFADLADFLQKWATTTSVLYTEQDYYDVAYELGRDMKRQNVLRREAMFDYTAAHESRVELDVMLSGLERGRRAVKDEFDVDLFFIANIDRTISPDRSLRYVEQLVGYKDDVALVGLGLESQEIGYPSGPHAPAFQLARQYGLKLSAHCGEEYAAGPEGVWEALESLDPDRIDHGNQAIRDDALVAHLVKTQIPVNLCPMSNVAINIYESVAEHPAKALKDRGVLVTIGSDDPPFMKASLTETYIAISEAFDLGRDDIEDLARNSFVAAYCDESDRKAYLARLDEWLTTARA